MVIRSVHRLFGIILTCPAQVLFRLVTCSIMSVTFVFSLTQMLVFLPRYVMFNILRSNFVFAAASLFFVWVVSFHVSAPYVAARSTYELQTCHVKYMSLKMSRCLAKAVHPAVILL